MSSLWAVQTALLAEMKAAMPTANVYSVGAVPDNQTGVYYAIGDGFATADDTDGRLGFQVIATVHSWDVTADARGYKNLKKAMSGAYSALHRANLAVTGYTLVDCLFEFEEARIDSDGLTAHGVQRFKILLTEI